MPKSKTQAPEKTGEKREFITLDVCHVGFAIYGIGQGVKKCSYRGGKLLDFLEELWQQMWKLKDDLNAKWNLLDRDNRANPKNAVIIKDMLAAGHWAYALCLDLQVFEKDCLGPMDTNTLRHYFTERLEEIYTSCFACAHMNGTPDQGIEGLRGTLIDFEVNGGVNHKTGKPGDGFYISILKYYIAYFAATERASASYTCFGELIEALVAQTERYPKLKTRWIEQLTSFLEEINFGFASTEFTSNSKVALKEKLANMRKQLEDSARSAAA